MLSGPSLYAQCFSTEPWRPKAQEAFLFSHRLRSKSNGIIWSSDLRRERGDRFVEVSPEPCQRELILMVMTRHSRLDVAASGWAVVGSCATVRVVAMFSIFRWPAPCIVAAFANWACAQEAVCSNALVGCMRSLVRYCSIVVCFSCLFFFQSSYYLLHVGLLWPWLLYLATSSDMSLQWRAWTAPSCAAIVEKKTTMVSLAWWSTTTIGKAMRGIVLHTEAMKEWRGGAEPSHTITEEERSLVYSHLSDYCHVDCQLIVLRVGTNTTRLKIKRCLCFAYS